MQLDERRTEISKEFLVCPNTDSSLERIQKSEKINSGILHSTSSGMHYLPMMLETVQEIEFPTTSTGALS